MKNTQPTETETVKFLPENEIPDHETTSLARTSAGVLSELLDQLPNAQRARIMMEGQEMIMPREAVRLLRDILADMAQGNVVSIVPIHAELTTQEAADLLNVSRPYLIKLIESGMLAHTKVGTHRRVLFRDVMDYKEQNRKRSANIMSKLTKQAQSHDMGY